MAREKWRTARREDLSGACCPCQCVSAELRLPTAGVRGGRGPGCDPHYTWVRLY